MTYILSQDAFPIDINRTSKVFKTKSKNVLALEDVTLSIHSGEFLSLVGPSGCGKSTLLRLIAGLIRPSSGEISIGGKLVTAPRDDIGIVFQAPVLLPWRTVLENVLLPVDVVRGWRARKAHEDKARSLLEMVGLGDFLDARPGQLSGGMQQRASICRALMLDPKVLLMDEPFGALDAITREQMGGELLRIWAEVGTTVVFITHSIPEAVFLSERVAVMSSRPGRVSDVYDVDLPRNRNATTYEEPRFSVLSSTLRLAIERDHGQR